MKRALPALSLLLLATCGPARIKPVQPELVPPQGDQDFGIVPVLNRKALDIKLTNVGRADLNIESATLKTDEGVFLIVSVPKVIESGLTAAIPVVFVPAREQDYTATLVIKSNDLTNPTVEVVLKGKGSTRAVMEVDPMVLDFGRVGECTSAVKTLTITSKGTADLILEELAITNNANGAFTFVGSSTTPATIKFKEANGLPGKIQLTVKYTVKAGASGLVTGSIHIRGTDPDKRDVTVDLKGQPNRAPVAVIAPLITGAPGLVIPLDGSGSSDPDGDTPLVYKWTMRSKPLSSNTTFASATSAVTSMLLDPQVPGAYEVQLDVTDSSGVKNCQSARDTVVATPAQALLIEMFWSNAKTDIDLHLLRSTTAAVSMIPDDCYYANPKPDWGAAGASQDPEFLRDALTGYGPELFGYVEPFDSTYRAVAVFANEHLDPMPASTVTVRVYVRGIVKGEFSRTLEKAGTRWPVADIEWPSGKITALP